MTLEIGQTVAESTQEWPEQVSAPDGAPNVVVVLLDDVGYSQLGCFGGTIGTPTIDRLAAGGLRYTDFHTTALCSPTRASLLTGRNSHSVSFGHVTERQAGFPGYTMQLPDSAATLAAILGEQGYCTWMAGKWHLTPPYETGPQGPFDRWPLGRGFQRFYGFLGGSTDQFRPELYRDNSPAPPPRSPEEGYHLTTDLVDQSITWIRELGSVAPRQPFFLHLAPGAGHAPHQAPREWIDHYRGAFDHGWDVERERVLARQIELGIVPPGTELGESNPGVEAWSELSDEHRTLYARMMEVYAGFLSHTDAELGRLVTHLEDTGQLGSTLFLLLSDNGASGEGGPHGSVDEGLFAAGRPQRAEDGLDHLDALGGPTLYNHYPWGWAQAGNTPFRWYKQFTHAGGNSNGLVVHWPGGGIPSGEVRRQYHHVIDIAPTILDVAGVEAPSLWRGQVQQPVHGCSMRYSFNAPDAPTLRTDQHYEVWGNRGYYRDGWMAVCRLQPDPPGTVPPQPMTPFAELEWELFDHRTDPTENHDLAPDNPELVAQLEQAWWQAAHDHQVLPIDTRHRSRRWPVDPPRPRGTSSAAETVFHGASGPYERGVAPRVAGNSFRLEARVTVDGAARGVLYSVGGHHGGYCWYVTEDSMALEVASSSIDTETVSGPVRLGPGEHRLGVRLTRIGPTNAIVALTVDGRPIAEHRVDQVLHRFPIGCGRSWVGAAGAPTVSGRVVPPMEFTGRVHELRVGIDPDPPAPTPHDESAHERREQ